MQPAWFQTYTLQYLCIRVWLYNLDNSLHIYLLFIKCFVEKHLTYMKLSLNILYPLKVPGHYTFFLHGQILCPLGSNHTNKAISHNVELIKSMAEHFQ